VPEKYQATLYNKEARQVPVPEKQPDMLRLWRESRIIRFSWERLWIFLHGTAAV
jgi:hypothetical protein